MTTHYDKSHFEADMSALGEVPTFPAADIANIDEQPEPRRIVIANGAGRSAVALLTETVPAEVFDENICIGSAARPVEYRLEDAALHANVPASKLPLSNPYALMAYFPEAAQGRGEAAYYELPDTELDLPDASRYITRHEAEDIVRDSEIPLSEELFVSRLEAEAAHHAYYDGESCARVPIEQFVLSHVPSVKLSVSPETRDGTFELLESTEVARCAVIQRLAYTGRVALSLTPNNLPIYMRGADDTLQRICGITAKNAIIPAEQPQVFVYYYIEQSPHNVADFVRQMHQNEIQNGGKIADAALVSNMAPNKAIKKGLITGKDMAVTPASALGILHKALTEGPDTPYLRTMRRQIGPAFAQEGELVQRARGQAHRQWQEVFAGNTSVQPSHTGLQAVAKAIGAYRTRGMTVTVNDATYSVGDGNMIFL